MRGTALHDRLVLAVAALFLCAHLAWLPSHLEDIDSINFSLGMRDYDVAAHQPHPPGDPVFTVLARGAARLVASVTPAPEATPAATLATRDARAMALLSAVAGTLALLALYLLLRLLDRGDSDSATPTALPLLATTLTAATPLFWVTAARPLSDVPGLAGALACQYLVCKAARPGQSVRRAILAAAACGVATGLRSQVAWLVVPLLVWLLVRVWRRTGVRAATGVAAAALVGVLAWAGPMIALTGGVSAYRAALVSQAGEDFDGVPMLVVDPGARRLVTALLDTFVSPWGWWPIAAGMVLIALAGVLAVRQQRRFTTWLALAGVPYLALHLSFQETETTRYALPLVPIVATLVVMALTRWVPRVAAPAAVGAIIVALVPAVQAHRQYVGADMSIDQALTRMDGDARQLPTRPQVVAHRRVWAESKRARAALMPTPGFDLLASPRELEWQAAVPAWERDATVWWLVDPRRGDRAAVDPRSMRLRERVAWPMPVAALLGGMRPHAYDWYDVSRPQWVLRDGWSLTPELAGQTVAAGQGLPAGTATALVRGRTGAATVLVGGRSVAPVGSTRTLAVTLAPAGREATWRREVVVPPGPFAFAWEIPADVMPAQGYVPLSIMSGGAASVTTPILLEQFDVQPAGVPVVALEQGWYEPERDVVSGRTWRWVADQSRLRVVGTQGDVRVVATGTYPRHYDRAPILEIFSGAQRLGTHTLARPFRVEQVVRARQLVDQGRLTWRVSPSFVAGERTGTADARRLALEIATLQVDAVR